LKVYIGADHRGVKYKRKVSDILADEGHGVVDVGTHEDKKSCDYPKIAFQVASQVAKSKGNRGILICMSGIGQTMAANKVSGAYAASAR